MPRKIRHTQNCASLRQNDVLCCASSRSRAAWHWCSGEVQANAACNDIKLKSHKPLGPSSFGGLGFRTGSRMLQSVPAQVKSQMQVASLLHTWEGKRRDATLWITNGKHNLRNSVHKEISQSHLEGFGAWVHWSNYWIFFPDNYRKNND